MRLQIEDVAAVFIAIAVAVAPLVVFKVVALSPVAPGGWLSDLFTIGKGRVIIVAGAMACMMMMQSSPKMLATLLFGAVLVFFPFVSAATSDYATTVFFYAGSYSFELVLVSMAYFALAMVASTLGNSWPSFTRALAVSTVIIALIAVREWVTAAPYASWAHPWLIGLGDVKIRFDGFGEPAAPLGNSNHLGTYAAMVGPLFIGMTAGSRWFAVPALAAFAAVVLSGSRGGMVGFGAACLVLGAAYYRRSKP